MLLLAARLLFKVYWGEAFPVTLMAVGIVFSASSFGVFLNSFLKNSKQGGVLYGGVLTVTGMIGMIRIFAMGSPAAATLGDTVSLLVPQGWAVRSMLLSMDGAGPDSLIVNTLVLLAWSLAFFAIGVWRFNRRYA